MSLGYTHTVTITRAADASGESVDDYGQPTGTLSDTTVYDGKGDFQYGMSTYERSQFGDADLDADGMLFLPESVDLSQFERGDAASISGVTASAFDGVVKGTDYLSHVLAIKLEGA